MRYSKIVVIAVPAMLVFAALAQSVSAQWDTAKLSEKLDRQLIMSVGLITDGQGIGGVGDLTVMIDKHVVGISFSSIAFGNVVAYREGVGLFDIFGRSETSYAADLTQMLAVHYGGKLTNAVWITGGLAWISEHHRSSINEHTDPGGLLTFGAYHADLVQIGMEYPAIPLTLAASLFKSGSWIGLIFHGQALISLNQVRFNAGASLGLGSFPD